MKIKLFAHGVFVCTLDGGPLPKGISSHAAAAKILDFWRDGEWLWIDGDKRAIRYDSITSIEVIPETGEHEITEEAS
jgi:hypothetical protein